MINEIQKKLQEYLKTEGYFNIRFLEDGACIANLRFLYTVAVVVGINEYGYERRICYPNETLAVACCKYMKTADDAPLPGYTALKG